MNSSVTDRRIYGSPARPDETGFAMSIGLCIIATCCLVFFSFNRADKTEHVLQSRINPNTASRDCLMQLPGIGPKTAQALVEYRQPLAMPAFRDAEDLQKVKGIGPKTVENIRGWLLFE